MTHSQYAQSGVDIDAARRAVEMMKASVQSTYGPEVLSDASSFGGLYDASSLKRMDGPVLVASTDGVGTKTRVAARMGRWDSIGHDLVNHCINDILVQGARPLFFLDYVAASKLDPQQIASIVGGMAAACNAAGCALLAGETAEMPGVYYAGELDVVGTIIGVVERSQLLTGSRVQPGDAILALPSTGLHTNGYSLARSVLADLDWHKAHPDLAGSPGDALLAPHRCYLREIEALRKAGLDLRGLAHITGGGVVDNLPRILLTGCGAVIRHGMWPILPIFSLIQKLGEVSDAEMFRVFNMGMGMLLILPANQVKQAQETLSTASFIVGEVVAGQTGITIEGGHAA